MFIYSGFSVLLEVVLSLENITLNANLNFEMIYYVSDPNLRTLGTDTSEVLESSRQRLQAASFVISACSDFVSRMHGQHLAAKWHFKVETLIPY